MPTWSPWAILAVGAVLTWQTYPGLPESWAVHYDASGVADSWVTKSPAAVVAPLAIGALAAAIFEIVGRLVPVRPPFPLMEPWRERMQRWQVESLRAVACGVAALMCVVALVLPHVESPHFLLLPVAAVLAVAFYVPASMLRRLTAEMEAQGALPPGYHGLTYRNPDDPRLLVPRLTGGGCTLNFGHWQAWLWLALAVALPVAALALLRG